MPARRRASDKQKDHEDAIAARSRVPLIIDSVPPEDLVAAIKRAPSLRGMILGYIAEEMFEKHLLSDLPEVEEVIKHDDHNREENKSDRSVHFRGRKYTVQLKSIQTNSIAYSVSQDRLIADVQNDASDNRTITLPNGNRVQTTCYQCGEYDLLAVPLFPFTQAWTFAYKRNRDCRPCTSNKYSEEDARYLLSTTEKIQWPLADEWTTDLISLLDDSLGTPLNNI